MVADVPVVILAGGRGARFDHETQVLPKPLIEVAGKPILGHIMDLFEDQGFHEFWVLGGYKWELIGEYLATRYECAATPPGYDDIRVFGQRGQRVSAHLFDTGLDATTGDRLMCLAYDHMMLTRPVILTYGDGLADIDVHALLEHHMMMRGRVHPQRPMVTVTAVQPPGRFGVIRFDDLAYHREDQDFVTGFEEKSERDWINGGFMVVDNGVVPRFVPRNPRELADGESFESFESGAMPRLAASHSLTAYRHHGYWRCMDTRRDLEQIEEDVRQNGGRPPWRRDRMVTT